MAAAARRAVGTDYAAVFAALPAPVLLLAPDAPRFTILDASDAYLQATMRTREALVGMGLFEAFPDNPDDPEADGARNLRASLERAVASGRPDAMGVQKYDVTRPDGGFEPRWWSPVNTPVLDARGVVTGVIHRVEDVTEVARLRVEGVERDARLVALEAELLGAAARLEQSADALAESEARFRNVADFSPMILWVTDETGRCQYLNRRWYDFTGQVPPEGEDRGWLDAVHPEDRAGVADTFSGLNAEAGPLRLEYRLRHVDGGWRWVVDSAAPRFDRAGRFQGYVGSVVDVDRDRRDRDRLIDANRALAGRVAERTAERDNMWRLSQDILVVVGPDAAIRAVSPSVRALGHAPEDLVGEPVGVILHPDDLPAAAEAIGRAMETVVRDVELRLRDADGGWRRYSWTGAPGGDSVYAVGRDVTEERARQAELDQVHAALRQSQKLEAMGQLTGGVAHDFNNLLTPILGGLDIVRRRGLSDPRLERLVDGALQSAERAKTLVQRLLAFARRQPLRAAAVDVEAVVRGMADLVASTSGPRIRLTLDFEPGLPPVLADANQLEMALLNLCVNARDAMPEGGVLTLAARAVEAGPAQGLAPGAYVRLSVSDTGVGMDEATLARAVEPFFSTKGVGHGTGLGLSMVHGLAAQLGGDLELRSRPGLGTTVDLRLPVAPEAAAVRPAAAEEAEAVRGAGLVLLVDDEPLVRAGTADMLAELGYRVREASSAEGALELLAAGLRPDAVVTDHLMPGVTGAELARRLRERSPGTPVLVISGYADVDALAPDLPRLNKPFRAGELGAALERLLPRQARPTDS